MSQLQIKDELSWGLGREGGRQRRSEMKDCTTSSSREGKWFPFKPNILSWCKNGIVWSGADGKGRHRTAVHEGIFL